MRVLFSTCSATHYMAPPRLSDEQVNCGPFLMDRLVGDRVLSLNTPKGDYDLAAVARRLPPDQQPDVVVCLVDASWFNTPRNLQAFSCPKVLLVADTHHMNKPLTAMFAYIRSQPYDRLVFLYSRHHLEFFRAAGFKNLFWLPSLTFPHADATVRAARAAEREPRITLIGQAGNLHARRLQLAGALAARDLPLFFREASQREALGLYGRSLIGFNASANSDLNLRAFEMLAAGTLMVMDRLPAESGADQLWTEGRELVTYRNAGELTERAAHYLAHPAEARAIGEAGARWFDEHFSEARRRAAFREVALHGREVPVFALPKPATTAVTFFRGESAHFFAATAAYEQVQLWHSRKETVRVLTAPGVPDDFARLCATLPRVTVEAAQPNEEGDLYVTSAAAALTLTDLPAPRLWAWDATPDQIPVLLARLKPAGLTQVRDDLAMFGLPGADAEPTSDPRLAEARRHIQLTDLKGALDLTRALLQEKPKCGEAYVVMAELALEANNRDLFHKMVGKALQLVPADASLHLLRAAAKNSAMRQTAAERLLTIALRHLSTAELGSARSIATRALQLDAKLAAGHYWSGQIALRSSARMTGIGRQREFGVGLKFLRAACRHAPERFDYALETAFVLIEGGLLAEAAQYFERALTFDTENAVAWYALGLARLGLGQNEAAVAALSQGLRSAPGDRNMLFQLGHALKRVGRVSDAVGYHRLALGATVASATARARRRVVFFVQHGPAWSSTESVYRAFAADPAWEAIVVALPYQHPFYTDATEERMEVFGFLERNKIPHVRFDRFALEPNFADIFFLQNPYDVTRPPGWKSTDLLKLAARLAYVPYGIEIGGGEDNARHQFNQTTQQFAWAVFARSERHKAMFARHCAGGDAHVAVTGHPKFDAQRDLAAVRDPAFATFAAGRKLVLWNPQFDVQVNGTAYGSGYSTFLRWSEFLLAEFARRQDLAFVIRPHPLFFATLDDRGIMDVEQSADFLRRCEQAGNILIDRRTSYLPVFEASAAMLTDASSFILEFAGTGRPLLYLHNPYGPSLNADGDFVREGCATAESESDIVRFLDDIAAGRDERRSQRLASYPRYVYRAEAGAGVLIKAEIERRLAAEDGHPLLAETSGVAGQIETQAIEAQRVGRSRAFWETCRDTHLAPGDYYARAAAALEQCLAQRITRRDRIVDFGCGNGEMTLLAARHGREATGYDLSATLVEQATAAARKAGQTNVRFAVLDLERGLPETETADAVMCLGVFACIHDDAAWLATLDGFQRILAPGGLLILRETVSAGARQTKQHASGYYGCYRPCAVYERAVLERGFEAAERVSLFQNTDGLENHLWVFRRSAPSGAPARVSAAELAEPSLA